MNLNIRQILADMPAFSAGMSPVSLVCLIIKTAYQLYKSQYELGETIQRLCLKSTPP